MRTWTGTAVGLLVIFPSAVQAAPELLASYYAEVVEGYAEVHDDEVEFCLTWDRGGPPNWVFFGRGEGVSWAAGETGTYTYDAGNTSNFHEFTALLGDGVSDQLIFWSFFPGTNCGQGLPRSEAEVFGTGSDLIGNYIDHICYQVHDVSFWMEGQTYKCSTAVTWGFWTPEPASLSLLALGAVVVAARRPRRAR